MEAGSNERPEESGRKRKTMAGSKTEFEVLLEKELAYGKTESFPVRTCAVRRLLTRKAECKQLHPNPQDEFCLPDIGPNYEIIAAYECQFRYDDMNGQTYYCGDPILVERLYPEGYRILNGHHRWAAALRMGKKTIPIHIVNVMHEADVKRILEQSRHTKRAAIDLDEVILGTEENGPLEKELSVLWNRFYQMRIRKGVPALFHFLNENGYDIWLFSAQYYSFDTIQNYFRKYHAEISGIVTAPRKNLQNADRGKSLERMIMDRYEYTVHIDNDTVVQIYPGEKDYRMVELKAEPADWSRAVIEAISGIEKESKKQDIHESIV